MKTKYIDSKTLDESKTLWYVTTEIATFRANDLTEVLLLWENFYYENPLDCNKAQNVGRYG